MPDADFHRMYSNHDDGSHLELTVPIELDNTAAMLRMKGLLLEAEFFLEQSMLHPVPEGVTIIDAVFQDGHHEVTENHA